MVPRSLTAPGSSTCRLTHKPSLFVVVGGALLRGERQRPYFPKPRPSPHPLNKKGRSQVNRCSATTAKGERCTLPANGSHGLCWTHAPEHAARRRRNASRAATAKADREIREVKAEIRRLINAVREEGFDVSAANTINRLYQTLLQYIVVERGVYREDDLAARIRELQGK